MIDFSDKKIIFRNNKSDKNFIFGNNIKKNANLTACRKKDINYRRKRILPYINGQKQFARVLVQKA